MSSPFDPTPIPPGPSDRFVVQALVITGPGSAETLKAGDAPSQEEAIKIAVAAAALGYHKFDRGEDVLFGRIELLTVKPEEA